MVLGLFLCGEERLRSPVLTLIARIAARFDPNLTFERGAGYGSTSFASRTSLQNQGRATTNSEIQTLFIR